MTVGDTIQSVNGAGRGGIVNSVNGKVGDVDVTASGVDSVDGRTGDVELDDLYLSLGGGTLTGVLNANEGLTVTPATAASAGLTVTGLAGQANVLQLWSAEATPVAALSASGVMSAIAFTVGTVPAATGALRLSASSSINWRSQDGTADVGGFSINALNQVQVAADFVPNTDSARSLGDAAKRWGFISTVILNVGGTVATSGAVRLNNTGAINWRNFADDGNIAGLTLNASDQLAVGAPFVPGSDNTRTLGVSGARWSTAYAVTVESTTINASGTITGVTVAGTNVTASTSFRQGAAPSATGGLRMSNASQIVWRNAAGNADINGWTVNSSDVLQFGASIVPGSDNTRTFGSTAARLAQINTVKLQIFSAGALGTNEVLRAGANPTTVDNLANTMLSATGSDKKPLVVQAAGAQTANVIEGQTSAGAAVFTVGPAGITGAPAFAASGLTGAVSATRYAGGTAAVAPTTGTFVTGDWVVAVNGTMWVCTAGGTPGTWSQVGAGSGGDANDPYGWGLVFTIDPILAQVSTGGMGGANRTDYLRHYGSASVTTMGLHVGTSSGNISVAAYGVSGTGRSAVPGSRLQTSGAVACPALGAAAVSLGGTAVLVNGGFLALSADTTAPKFWCAYNAGIIPGSSTALFSGRSHVSGVHPAPSPATLTFSNYADATFMLTAY